MKKKATRYDYEECEMCNTPIQEKLIKQDFRTRGELIVVEDVPAGVCPQCGEKVAKAPRVSVPTIKFEKTSIV